MVIKGVHRNRGIRAMFSNTKPNPKEVRAPKYKPNPKRNGMKVERNPKQMEFKPLQTDGDIRSKEAQQIVINELGDEGLKDGFYKWFGRVHKDKANPQIQAIKMNKIYFTYDGSDGELMVFTKLIQDLYDRENL